MSNMQVDKLMGRIVTRRGDADAESERHRHELSGRIVAARWNDRGIIYQVLLDNGSLIEDLLLGGLWTIT